MTEPPEVGSSTKEKIDALARYLNFYTKVFMNLPWWAIYLDANAGGGRAVIRSGEGQQLTDRNLFSETPQIDGDARELIEGSPRVALGIANPFDRYISVDFDLERSAR